jgi:DNA repair protein RadC
MAKKLLTHFGNPEAIFKVKSHQIASIDGIGSVLLQN